MGDKAEVIICDCGDSEHQLLIACDNDFPGTHKEVSIEPHLVTYNGFFKRLWIGLKYAFGYKSRYGHWDCIIINKENYQPLKKAIEFLESK